MANVRNDRRVRYTKTVLKTALIDLMQEKPIGKITIKEICEKADINRGTFYTHYSDQFDLQNQILGDILSQVTAMIGESPKRVGDGIALANVFRYIYENRRAISVLIGENSTIHLQDEVLRYLEDKALFERMTHRADGEYLYQFIACGCFGIVRQWVENGTESPEYMANLVNRLTANGLSDFS